MKKKAKRKTVTREEREVRVTLTPDIYTIVAKASMLCKQPVDVIIGVLLAVEMAKRQ